MMKKKFVAIIYAIGVILCFWTLLSMTIDSIVVPSPLATVLVLKDIAWTKLLPNLLVSYRRLLVATVISLVLGSVIGIGAGMSKRLASLIMPVIQLLYPIPRAAFLPIFLVFFGIKDSSKIVLMVAVSIFYFIIPFYDTVRTIPEAYHKIAKTLNFSKWQWIRHVILPACTIEFFTAVKMTVGASMATLFFAENIAGSSGIAYYIMNAWGFSNYPAMYAGIVVVSISGVLVFSLIDFLAQKLTPWEK